MSRLRALVVAAAVVLAAAADCDEPVEPVEGCAFDDDCAPGERCAENGSCVAQGLPDAGTPPRDSGVVAVDAGPVDAGRPTDAGSADAGAADAGAFCLADGLNNGTAATAPELIGVDGGGPVATGHLCGGVDEHFSFFGFENDLIILHAAWSADADLDLEVRGDATAVDADVASTSTERRFEAGSGLLTATATNYVRLFAFQAAEVPPAGLDYELQFRSGLPCLVDDECTLYEGNCLLPLWTPYSATGDPPDPDVVFAGGACAAPFATCDVPDDSSAEGLTDRRTNASTPTSTVTAWSCGLDEDWFRHSVGVTGDVSIGFANASSTSGAYLVMVVDDVGNVVGGAGWVDLPGQQTRSLLVPKVRSGTELFVRVVQLHEDDFGLYTIGISETPATCGGDGDCAGDEYGRTRCQSSACACQENPLVPGRCTPG